MKRPFFRSLLVGLLFVLAYYGAQIVVQIIQGMFLTANYVPDIVEKYESVDDLQHKIAFGVIYSPISIWEIAGEIIGLMLLGIAVYYAGRRWRERQRREH